MGVAAFAAVAVAYLLYAVRSRENAVAGAALLVTFNQWIPSGGIALLNVHTLLLAGVGLYGVVAYSTSRRTHEIGIRMALGAGPEEIRRSVLKESLVAVALGMAIGSAAAIAATRYLETLLFGVSRRDPASILVTACALLAVGILAGYLPARRASRSDPLASLRHE